ncbi:hypothetical protein PF005_g22907 [Phytophthora fragariae]|uniref:Uncharacterized protein n=1 Tax=Phytophthora fragariae TaxID=53985 RepID=A0A6A3SHB8_9STRA|nr:hypothetical protein PF007_g10700 [Phytophthora fragariae]KAE9181384.1 hypothetical protein PF005_g22907 [Phytophthora fragariae]
MVSGGRTADSSSQQSSNSPSSCRERPPTAVDTSSVSSTCSNPSSAATVVLIHDPGRGVGLQESLTSHSLVSAVPGPVPDRRQYPPGISESTRAAGPFVNSDLRGRQALDLQPDGDHPQHSESDIADIHGDEDKTSGEPSPDDIAAVRPHDRIWVAPVSAHPVAPRVSVAHVKINASVLEASISDLRNLLDQLEALRAQGDASRDLLQDHEILQRAHQALRQEMRLRKADLAEVRSVGASFVQFGQAKYDRLRDRLEASQLEVAEMESALIQRQENEHEIVRLEDKLRVAEQVHQQAFAQFQNQVDALKARIAASPSSASSLQFQKLKEDRDATLANLRQQTTALKASENTAARLLRQVNGQLTVISDLRADANRERVRSQRMLDDILEERDRIQARLDHVGQDLQNRLADLRRTALQRDRVQQDLDSTRAQVTTQRTSISRLEQQVVASQANEIVFRQLTEKNTLLVAERDAARRACRDAEAERDRLLDERRSAQTQLAALTSILNPALPSEPSRPTTAPDSRKGSSQSQASTSRQPGSTDPTGTSVSSIAIVHNSKQLCGKLCASSCFGFTASQTSADHAIATLYEFGER